MPSQAARVPLIRGDAVGIETDYRDALPVNLTAVSREILGSPGYLISHSGLTSHAEGVGPDRGGIWNERLKKHFRLSGTKLITVDAEGVTENIGDIFGSDRATMTAYSFNTQAIVANGKYYLYDGTNFVEVDDPDVGSPIDVCWIDFYYFFTDGETLYHTDLVEDPENPGSQIPVEDSISPLTFATAEFSPDPTLGVAKTSDNLVAVFNRYTTEWFANQASANFAFSRLRQRAVKCGIVGTHCKVEMEGRFFVLGSGKDESVSVHILGAGDYKSIATREIDKIINKYTEAELALSVVETRIESRDKFIIVRLPNETLLYNDTIAQATGVAAAWSVVKSGDTGWRGVNGVFDPRIPSWVYGDAINSTIGLLDDTTAGQYGEQVESIFYTPFIQLDGASIEELEIETLPGSQSEPDEVKTAISLSYDGLHYETEYHLTYGNQYDRSQRFIYHRLGKANDYAGIKFRTKTIERLNFAALKVRYG